MPADDPFHRREAEPAARHVELTAIPLNLANLTADETRRVALLEAGYRERVEALHAGLNPAA